MRTYIHRPPGSQGTKEESYFVAPPPAHASAERSSHTVPGVHLVLGPEGHPLAGYQDGHRLDDVALGRYMAAAAAPEVSAS